MSVYALEDMRSLMWREKRASVHEYIKHSGGAGEMIVSKLFDAQV